MAEYLTSIIKVYVVIHIDDKLIFYCILIYSIFQLIHNFTKHFTEYRLKKNNHGFWTEQAKINKTLTIKTRYYSRQ